MLLIQLKVGKAQPQQRQDDGVLVESVFSELYAQISSFLTGTLQVASPIYLAKHPSIYFMRALFGFRNKLVIINSGRPRTSDH